MSDGLNDQRAERVADLLSDFRTLQYYIAGVSTEPLHQDDYYCEGWAALRQCSIDGQHVLNSAAETRVPRVRGGPEEQAKAELQQVMLDAFARRHEAQKIYLRQGAALRWVEWRDSVLAGERPHGGNANQLDACDVQLRVELAAITDDSIYADMRSSDYQMGRWTQEDPRLRDVQRWVRARQ
ncbi:hypothetical protein GLAREA_04571 [Glarea lozoyensis ATCC 20868]|uniref:Uncharacterized protein n=1 Tax=Glarea lozoyensis (strain ATCC 20868 / MF5171) TaxID=1116229 RepID=S3CQ27_GLAL2|nr:uncharacterized protein GLAREA_04571 [Glarea lozoyensis ATCC 20868]EPE27780.1 hypothetical protein GLAREA_04571 [Glarea lozoyensis ATCC 20868]